MVWRSILPERKRAAKGTTADVAHWLASIVQQASNLGGHLPRDECALRVLPDDDGRDAQCGDDDADDDSGHVRRQLRDTTILEAMDIAADLYRDVVDPPEVVNDMIDG